MRQINRVFYIVYLEFIFVIVNITQINSLVCKALNIENNNITREDLSSITGGHTVPQIIIGEKYIGGYTELLAINQSGELDRMLLNEN